LEVVTEKGGTQMLAISEVSRLKSSRLRPNKFFWDL
jgi:hypothetical protein